MKKILLSGLLVGLTVSVFAQGQVNVRNIFNTDQTPGATANGLIFLNNAATPTLVAQDFNLAIYGGATAGSLSLLFSYTGSATTGINAAGPGTFFEPDIATIQGATATGFFQIQAWTGNAATFAAWQQAGVSGTFGGQTAVFSNPLGNPNASPPGTPAELSGMPALILNPVPEPSTFALAGLGAAALLIFRRRK